MDDEKIDGGLSALTEVLEIFTGRSGGRMMHLEDQTEVVCFRPHDLARFAELVAASEREWCAMVCAQLEVHDIGHPGTAFAVQGACIDAIRRALTTL